MDVKEVLRLADDLIFTKTGKHLDDLEQAILRGTVQGEKYSKIAEENHCTHGHVKDVASQLWNILSQELGEDVRKSNFRATLERLQFSNVLNFTKDIVQIGSVNVCGDTPQSSEVAQNPEAKVSKRKSPQEKTRKIYRDLSDAPDISSFYGCTEELTILEKWIVCQRCRLVTLLGISGIGKTTLAVKLVEQIKDKFEYVIWRSLRTSPPPETIQRNLLQFFYNQEETELPVSRDEQLSQLKLYLQKYRCLVILDDLQMIFTSGQLAGYYKPGYEDYGLLFKLIGELSHHSCFILIGWEAPIEIIPLTGENTPIRSLHLNGLGIAASKILTEKGLVKNEKWEDLINTYRGNPLWLKSVATMIRDLFNGRVSDYIKYDSLFLGNDLLAILNQQYQRLSELEKTLISLLARETESLTTTKLLEETKLSPSELFNGIQSLVRRSLIEKQEQDNQTLFTLAPIIREYIQQIAGL
ncbi:NB-ARC domain-containing protein [Limnofasciculus baicalensis]|uniref:NB-ARC domain-containing protein n=1 Tax=Limnofasciculus baicalensis BBK-W-15 TaxID=2699891 RepID=A0AAE3GXI3_9CYAN|nr:NB-ARC domain-containing protein [Limnofasciculus baicalensis]MCP2731631.1 NB-ARC domain-containing protein [Limnofasciculus baicalensis BBK-W-15]